ncbi:uncharacterized protein TA20920 [Theileria annulata]|uniref:Snf7 n=1 Tax=Theileria annulata TaxID=5874 RepID=Q4UGX1_THEAN|nr:uncharacterized protein TA20920 [Theileria annulata]CAI73668.1 hypothetical protein, conserved [Theileria annulata]|eukprot:XP_954345.1 hypothetical protein, conserved [Theileria annulata]
MGGSQSLMDTKFNLTLQSREAQKLHYKCLKEEEDERIKVKSAIESNNPESARIHATNSIFKRNEAMRFLEFKSRLDILSAQIDSAMRTQQLTEELKKVLPQLNKFLKYNKLDSVDVITDFKKIFENMDGNESYTGENVNRESSFKVPPREVEALISRVAQEYDLDMSEMTKKMETQNESKPQSYNKPGLS